MTHLAVDATRLLRRLNHLGGSGRDAEGRLARLAASDADRQGRDCLVGWIREHDLDLIVDRIGTGGVTVSAERLARFEPVVFAPSIVNAIESAAAACQLTCRRMTSGSGHDAQMIARIAPAAMVSCRVATASVTIHASSQNRSISRRVPMCCST